MVLIRATRDTDEASLVAGRDAESRRFLGEGGPHPRPAFCIESGGIVVGWVDYDTERSWLLPCEVNIGYNVFPEHRGHGYATIAVRLLFDHLHEHTNHTVATLLIDKHNERSIAVANRLGCVRQPDFDGHPYFKVDLRRHARNERQPLVDELLPDLAPSHAERTVPSCSEAASRPT